MCHLERIQTSRAKLFHERSCFAEELTSGRSWCGGKRRSASPAHTRPKLQCHSGPRRNRARNLQLASPRRAHCPARGPARGFVLRHCECHESATTRHVMGVEAGPSLVECCCHCRSASTTLHRCAAQECSPHIYARASCNARPTLWAAEDSPPGLHRPAPRHSALCAGLDGPGAPRRTLMLLGLDHGPSRSLRPAKNLNTGP